MTLYEWTFRGDHSTASSQSLTFTSGSPVPYLRTAVCRSSGTHTLQMCELLLNEVSLGDTTTRLFYDKRSRFGSNFIVYCPMQDDLRHLRTFCVVQ
jgi:hypothetical protein